jgi:hypothetical protein
MLAIAASAISCLCFLKFPGIGFQLLTFLIAVSVLSIGPLIGSVWVRLRCRDRKIDPVTGGLIGGAVQATLLVWPCQILPLYIWTLRTLRSEVWIFRLLRMDSIWDAFLVWLILLAAHAATGWLVGLLVSCSLYPNNPAPTTVHEPSLPD